MNFSIQKELSNDNVILKPLQESDFEALFFQAADEEVWSQHPNKNRFKREVFENFFVGALESKGTFIIIDKPTNQIIGSTRFYDFNEIENSIFIGYTFYGKKFWGKNYNSQVKKLMLDYIFQFVDYVNFYVGNENFRSQKAMEKLGAENRGEVEIAYFSEESRSNFLYLIKRKNWFV
ncbi:GNAT family N-acetyltransferase [Halpernia frigidisoli]|uniref:Protein N-acetyltransferase, RimJ/RimL family n=1 Tax=Halpernia frigidisoli TaxID=1125876 RepID=A0A1I3DI11_9FLAO|nr:GNAT family N-acetyltransferase [Halpernia frigidisoli]SFH86365.1 Protein N-acetyltransferase, RimJ/RimL family [Halpernia frigidisoli]